MFWRPYQAILMAISASEDALESRAPNLFSGRILLNHVLIYAVLEGILYVCCFSICGFLGHTEPYKISELFRLQSTRCCRCKTVP